MPSLVTSRLTIYGAFSTVLVSAVIASAFHKHSNFYSATVFLSRSSASVLANYGVLLALLFGRFLQRLFFGRLSNQEVERLYDRTWFFLTESLLAFTIFRDEFDAPFVVMFGVLLFLKCFHWLIADRMDWMDQQPYPGPPMLFHLRTNVMFFILWTVDILMLQFAIETVLTHGVGGIVLFGSEYAILLASCLNSVLKYFVMVYDLRRARTRGGEDAPIWENKSMCMFYIELITDFLKLGTYLTFFMIVMTFFGLPLNIIRDVYMTGVSFYTRFRDLLRYRAATKDMETKYPNATPAELEVMSDRTCIICREEMVVQSRIHANPPEVALGPNGLPQPGQTLGLNDPPKKLPCGHVFHFQCLRSWLERQQSCPTCRRSVLEGMNPDNTDGNGGNAANRPNRHDDGNLNGGRLPFVPRDVPLGPPAQLVDGNGREQNQNAVPQVQPHALRNGVPPVNAHQELAGDLLNGLGVTGAGTLNDGGGANRVSGTQQTPPRAFHGFNVGGVWHPWEISGLDGEAAEASGPSTTSGPSSSFSPVPPQPSAPTATASRAPAASSPAGPSATPEGLASPSGSSNGTVTPTSAPAPPTPGLLQEAAAQSASLTPREAAAAAALKRFAAVGSKSGQSSATTTNVTPVPTRTVPPRAESLPAISTLEAKMTPPSASIPSPTSNSSSFVGQTDPPPKHVSVPTLIPLFDPSSVAHRPFINLGSFADISMTSGMMSPATPAYFSNPLPSSSSTSVSGLQQPPSFPWILNNMGPFSATSTPASQTPARTPARVHSSANLSAMFSAAMSNNNAAAPPVIPITPDLNSGASFSPRLLPFSTPNAFSDDAGLRRLDALTREAIDERLKVLEDVQMKLWSAAEELKRVKSALPPMTSSSASGLNLTGLPTSLPVEGYVSAPQSGYASVVRRSAEVVRNTAELVSSVEEGLRSDVVDSKGKGKGKARAVEKEEPSSSVLLSEPQP
ncbi:uncharacterized protein EI90DRAFT_3123127 [Cantharellus anzutake]|uniref:uncharacterized protein n=1 Tax=Cantharellus anzutake TaxID=1750568 RepID=UPI0019047944|nr:uncharacterized protein EI90DRAFT_3123127 [Cantharellus anzutake]KAF8332050.1 hypothetical protein EI90DRAFT_3123127 [Cantharellus anzutake]